MTLRKFSSRAALAAILAAAAGAAAAQTTPSAPQPYRPSGLAPATAPRPAPVEPEPLRPDQIALLQQALSQAASHGLEPRDYDVSGYAPLLASQDAAARAPAEAALWKAALRYAKALHAGRLPESAFLNKWSLRAPAYDPAPGLARAVREDRLQAWLDALPPPYASYQDLRGGLATYRAIAEKGGWKPVPEGPVLKIGSTGPRVAALRARLAAEDPAVSPLAGPVFDQALADAVMRAQKRFGLKPDGEVGKPTLGVLNVPVQERIDQIVANMERWRWLPPSLPAHRVQVNVAAAVLALFQDDQPVLSMRAATGKPGDETPMLASEIHSIVLNPPWNVPQSIAANELWPKERANPGYFARNGYKVISLPGGGNRIQQAAGPNAALGQLKFDFENSHAVYLHDTPSRGAFDRYSRLVSHGCVRLQKPVLLAREVLEGDPNWTPQVLDEALASGETQRVQLPQRVAVYLLYWTAYVTPDGQVNFRNDPYGWDKELIRRLDALPTAPAIPAA